MQDRYCLQMVACNGGCGSDNSGDGTPVGTIISYMGLKAPQHYLVCDGTVLNIADYPKLTQQIQAEFGAGNYFGGDGATTFAVPDLRNEFLRGHHGEAAEQLSGELGRHQDATKIPYFYLADYGKGIYIGVENTTRQIVPENRDKLILSDDPKVTSVKGIISDTSNGAKVGVQYMSRPTNMAVLYCIKYE